MVIINIVVFIFVLGLVILIHELGHFIMAKKANILCHEFSLGMGPILWSKRIKETLYCVRAIPIGGYVMMAGEEVKDEVISVGQIVRLVFNDFNEIVKIIIDHESEKFEQYEKVTIKNVDLKGENNSSLLLNEYVVKRDAFFVFRNKELQIAPLDRSFESKTKLQRFFAIFAGPFMNFVLAFFIFIIINLIQGFPVMESTELGAVDSELPAYEILEVDDKILSISGVDVENWDDISDILDQDPSDREVLFTILRDEIEIDLIITPTIFFYSVGFHSQEGDIDDLIIGEINPDSFAGLAGILEGDMILTIDTVEMNSWGDVIDAVEENAVLNNEGIIIDGEQFKIPLTFEVLRDGETFTIKISDPHSESILNSQGVEVVETYVGISPPFEFDFLRSITGSVKDIEYSAGIIFTTIDLLFNSYEVEVSQLAGPVGIYEITSRALSAGFLSFLTWTALLSVNLGIINLLPIPALDGGRLVFLAYETITRKKPNRRVENTLHYVMYLLLMGLFVYITYNDILRLLNIR